MKHELGKGMERKQSCRLPVWALHLPLPAARWLVVLPGEPSLARGDDLQPKAGSAVGGSITPQTCWAPRLPAALLCLVQPCRQVKLASMKVAQDACHPLEDRTFLGKGAVELPSKPMRLQ